MPSPTLRDAFVTLDAVPRGVETCRGLSNQELLDASRTSVELRRLADAHAALVAGEIARRSTPDLGKDGLLAKAGHRNVEEFLKTTTGMTGRDAVTLTRVGRLTNGTGTPGLEKVATAVIDGTMSAQAADAIHRGLGTGTDHIPTDLLDQAARQLCQEAQSLDADRLHNRAREIRDELDDAGIHGREQALRAQRSLKFFPQPDGLSKLIWTMDPVTANVIAQIWDRATSPKRGGPRFVDSDLATRIEQDERTTEQYASDAFTELLTQAATVDESVLLKGHVPTVKVIVSDTYLVNGTGHGIIEGSNEPVSIQTVQRLACNGITPYLVDSVGQILDQGRDQRYFTPTQKTALALRDGGCMAPGCARPPSFCEAHHINDWHRKRGRTDLCDGILLCRHHHLKLHNEGWSITRKDGRYYLHTRDGEPPILLQSKSRAIREHLQRQRT